jgi:hypothetical protein
MTLVQGRDERNLRVPDQIPFAMSGTARSPISASPSWIETAPITPLRCSPRWVAFLLEVELAILDSATGLDFEIATFALTDVRIAD